MADKNTTKRTRKSKQSGFTEVPQKEHVAVETIPEQPVPPEVQEVTAPPIDRLAAAKAKAEAFLSGVELEKPRPLEDSLLHAEIREELEGIFSIGESLKAAKARLFSLLDKLESQ